MSEHAQETPGEEPVAGRDESGLPDPGFGVGYSNDDVDDVSPPEVHEGELPVGFELSLDDAGLLEPELDEPSTFADHDAHGLPPHDGDAHGAHGHDAGVHHGDGGDGEHDGAADLLDGLDL